MESSCDLSSLDTRTLLDELMSRGVFTSSPTNQKVLENKGADVQLIATFGPRSPQGTQQCRECRQQRPDDHFSYYQARVYKNGFLARSNAMCRECAKESNKQRKEVLDNADIPPKPRAGTHCPHCQRAWSGNWHRHHVGDKFVGWLCGHCNMSFSDQRNKNAR